MTSSNYQIIYNRVNQKLYINDCFKGLGKISKKASNLREKKLSEKK